jgi:hypothetical protein
MIGFDGLGDISFLQRLQLQSFVSRMRQCLHETFGTDRAWLLRRDIGIWTGILAIIDMAIGLTVHLTNSKNFPRCRRGSVLGSGAYLDVPDRETIGNGLPPRIQAFHTDLRFRLISYCDSEIR